MVKYLLFPEELKHLTEGLKNTPVKNLKKNLKKNLLAFENIKEEDFNKAMKNLKKYRNKEVSHKELYPLKQFNNPETKRFYPELLLLFKFAFSFLKKLLTILPSVFDENEYKNIIALSLISRGYNFDDFIDHLKKDLKPSLDFFLKEEIHDVS